MSGCYEEIRRRHISYVEGLVAEFLPRLQWSRATIEAEQISAVRVFLEYAIRHSPWHRKRLRRLNLERLSATRFADIPPMTKADLMEHWDEIVTDNRCSLKAAEAHLATIAATGRDAYFLDQYHVCASGGSSGTRGVFAYDWHGWAAQYAAIVRMLINVARQTSADAAGKLAVVAAHAPTHMSGGLTQTFSSSSRPVIRAPVTLALAEIGERLNRAQPVMLSCYASMLPVLAEEARAGRLRISPAVIWSASEVLLPEARAMAEATWQVPVVNAWMASEGPGAIGCHVTPGFHIAEDLNVIEPVDEDLKPVPRGNQSASILLTNFSNKLIPLIRYQITDRFRLTTQDCACGLGYLKVDDVIGRLEDVFDYGSGLKVHPHIFSSVLGKEPAITMYQVRQTIDGAEVDLVASVPFDTHHSRCAIEQGLAQLGVRDPQVRIQLVPDIPRQSSGKLKRFIPLGT